MKIEAIQGANINQLPNAKAGEPPKLSALERAKAAFMKPTTETQAAAQGATPPQTPLETPQQSQNDTVESISAPAESPQAETKAPDEALSSHYAILARKEKALRQREQQLRAKEAATRAQEEAAKAPPKPAFDESKYIPKDRLTQDPFAVLGELGLTYDQLTEFAMNAPKQEQIMMSNELKALKAELAALKGETEQTKKTFQESQDLSRTQAIASIKAEVSSLVRQDPSLEMIKSTSSIDDVVGLIEKVYDTDGILLTVEEAAQEVENYLTEEALKLSKLKKIQQRLQPSNAAAPKTTGQPQKTPLKTLTNSIASSRQLSARERAILAFKGEDK